MQSRVQEFIARNDLSCGKKLRYIDFVSEIGELGKEILKSTNYGKKEYSIDETAVEEMGDCLFSLLALCCEMGIDAENALSGAMEKYQQRLEKSGQIGSGQ